MSKSVRLLTIAEVSIWAGLALAYLLDFLTLTAASTSFVIVVVAFLLPTLMAFKLELNAPEIDNG